MCTTCGCGGSDDVRYTTLAGVARVPQQGQGGHLHDHDHRDHQDHDHVHDRGHAHAHDDGHAHEHDYGNAHGHGHTHAHRHHPRDAHDHASGQAQERGHSARPGTTIELGEDLLAKNQRLADRNRGWLAGRGVVAINLMSSPGAGKTTLLERSIRALGKELDIHVVEGDQATLNDAERIEATGCKVVQVNTGTGCHLEADMLARSLRQLQPGPGSLVMIENVGNLVCPALFDLGERVKVVLLSVTDGEDKPLKYPHMFRASQVMILNKIDLLPHVRFGAERCITNAREINPNIRVFRVSAETGEGLDEWHEWLRRQVASAGKLDAAMP